MMPMDEPQLPDKETLWMATALAFLVAVLVLGLFVLPAEYGVDPTGFGALVGLTALAGDVDFEETNATMLAGGPLQNYSFSFESHQRLIHRTNGTSAVGQIQHVTLGVTSHNITRLVAALHWQDDAVANQPTEPDTFDVTMTSPDGERRTWTGRNDGENGELHMPFVLTRPPNPIAVEETSLEAALEAAHNKTPADAAAIGAWNISITLREAGGLGAVADEGNSWTLDVFETTRNLTANPPAPTNRRTDTVQIVIPARTGIEYKVGASESAKIEYVWDATAPLYYDLHSADSTNRESSIEQGVASARTGGLDAPFAGRHGWYWRNDGGTPVTVTLELRGAYHLTQS